MCGYRVHPVGSSYASASNTLNRWALINSAWKALDWVWTPRLVFNCLTPVQATVLCEYCVALVSLLSRFLSSWPSEVRASNEESHWTVSWFGKSLFLHTIFVTVLYRNNDMYQRALSPSMALMMTTGVCLERKTTRRKSSSFSRFYVQSVIILMTTMELLSLQNTVIMFSTTVQ